MRVFFFSLFASHVNYQMRYNVIEKLLQRKCYTIEYDVDKKRFQKCYTIEYDVDKKRFQKCYTIHLGGGGRRHLQLSFIALIISGRQR